MINLKWILALLLCASSFQAIASIYEDVTPEQSIDENLLYEQKVDFGKYKVYYLDQAKLGNGDVTYKGIYTIYTDFDSEEYEVELIESEEVINILCGGYPASTDLVKKRNGFPAYGALISDLSASPEESLGGESVIREVSCEAEVF